MLVSSVAPTTEDVPSADTDKGVAVCDGSVEDSCNTLEDDLDEDEGEEVKVVDTGREGEDDGEEDVVAEEVDGVLENVSELVLGAVVSLELDGSDVVDTEDAEGSAVTADTTEEMICVASVYIECASETRTLNGSSCAATIDRKHGTMPMNFMVDVAFPAPEP